jgi:glycosyltransferase involved in cell wall biosynthesis
VVTRNSAARGLAFRCEAVPIVLSEVDPVRVLHCIPWLTSGGVERRRLELARRLSKRYTQRVVCLRAKAELRSQFEQAGVPVTEVQEPFGVRALAEVARVAWAWQPSLVHGAVFEGVFMANVGAFASSTAQLVVEEIAFPSQRSWRGNLLFRLANARAQRSVAVSPAVLSYLRGTAHIPERKIRLIVNGISAPVLLAEAERRNLKQALRLPADAFVVGSVGRVNDSIKRFSDLIAATADIAAKHPKLYLLIVGDGHDRPGLEALATQLGVSERVRFAGYQHDVGPMYSVMDLFALASARESFGLALVEAMFSGLAVVATNVGGIPGIVADRETGLLVPVANPQALAVAISSLVSDAAQRDRMAAAGLARAKSLFGAERYVKDVETLYEELVAPPDGGAFR